MSLKHTQVILKCMIAKEIRHTMQEDDHLNEVTAFMINGWLSTTAEVKEEIKQYWQFHDFIVIIDDIVMKGRIIVVPALL